MKFTPPHLLYNIHNLIKLNSIHTIARNFSLWIKSFRFFFLNTVMSTLEEENRHSTDSLLSQEEENVT